MTEEQEELHWFPEEIEIGDVTILLSFDNDKYTLEDNVSLSNIFLEHKMYFDTKKDAYSFLMDRVNKVKYYIDEFLEKGLEERWNKKNNQTSAMYVEAKTT